MDTQSNINSGDILSFYKLLKEKNCKIVIPIIQRDYAQGREKEKEVREKFISALYRYLDEGKPFRDLDFIYGTIKKNNNLNIFIPLDGQQRLTTLFLLHWYLYQINDNELLKEKFYSIITKDGKARFSYETRSSSSEFCDALVSHDINLNDLINDSISDTIKNSPWYFLSWNYDPTIQAMLIMLDSIHKKFKDNKEFFEKLLDEINPVITFKFLNLEEYNLTDDLYIKMNSRGKPLSPFENFKAQFEKFINNLKLSRKFNLNGREVSAREYFSYKIDTIWADFFWTYRNLQNRSNFIDNNFDDEIMNFIRVLLTFKYAETLDIKAKEKDESLEYLLGTAIAKKQKDYVGVISFYKYQELGVLKNQEEYAAQAVFYLIEAFDNVANTDNYKLKTFLNPDYKFFYDEEEIFKKALKHEFQNYHERLMFYAWLSYIFKYNNELQLDNFNQWIRVIHNLTHPDNSRIDNATDFAKALLSIKSISDNANYILSYLKKNDTDISFFSSWQITEEKIKAHLIAKNEDWKKEIESAEKHKYFNGQIGFILEFSGIWDYYSKNKNCNWNNEEDKIYLDKFMAYSKIASFIFYESYENRINNKDFIFERAVLVKGDYLTEASAGRYNLLSTNQVKNNIKRDHSWKRLLRVVDDENWKKKRGYVREVLDDIIKFIKDDYQNDFSNENIISALKKIISQRDGKLESWRDYFINCPSFFKYSRQGFIRFENEIRIYGESQSNHLHVEMYTYYIWKKLLRIILIN